MGVCDGCGLKSILAMEGDLARASGEGHGQGIIVKKDRAEASQPIHTKDKFGTMYRESKTVHREYRSLDGDRDGVAFTLTCNGRPIANRDVKRRRSMDR